MIVRINISKHIEFSTHTQTEWVETGSAPTGVTTGFYNAVTSDELPLQSQYRASTKVAFFPVDLYSFVNPFRLFINDRVGWNKLKKEIFLALTFRW